MAVDTAAKRYSMMTFGFPVLALVNVNASVEADDRSTWLDLYGGITLGEPPAEVPGGQTKTVALIAARRRRIW